MAGAKTGVKTECFPNTSLLTVCDMYDRVFGHHLVFVIPIIFKQNQCDNHIQFYHMMVALWNLQYSHKLVRTVDDVNLHISALCHAVTISKTWVPKKTEHHFL
jgi:hypothetical protein